MTTDKKSGKPREYGVSGEMAMLLKPDWDIEKCKDYIAQFGRCGDPEPIHVIEYSAYDELVALAKDLAEALKNIEFCPRSISENVIYDMQETARDTLERHRDLLARLQGE